MSRWVVPARPGLVGGTDSPDGPLARVVKVRACRSGECVYYALHFVGFVAG